MHKLHDKKERKTHYFDHVTEHDGSKKHVYLGSDSKAARDRLMKLKVERIRSSNKLIKELNKVQTKLDKLTHNSRSYDDKIVDVRKRYYQEKNIDAMLAQDIPSQFPLRTVMISVGAVLILVPLGILAMTNPALTGAAVTGTAELISTRAFITMLAIGAGMAAIGLSFYAIKYHDEHKHDKYKPRF